MESSEPRKKEVPYSGCVLLIILLLVAFAVLPCIIPQPPRSREAEIKADAHTIQIAIERYYVDHGHYPPYLLGGDIDGWKAWHEKWDGVNDFNAGDGVVISNADVKDPLLDEGYMISYPTNPFVDYGSEVIKATNVSGSAELGDGDPRFGFKGNIMGMTLDDPNFFAYHPGRTGEWSKIETRRTLDHGVWMDVPEPFKRTEYGLYYLSGGLRKPAPWDDVSYVFSPGNFFYRAAPELQKSRAGFTLPYPNGGIEGECKHYMLGAYGGEGPEGADVIRLEPADPEGNLVQWRVPAEYALRPVYCGYGDFSNGYGGLPEVFGGGDEKTGPFWPYDQGGWRGDKWVYGASDGVPDGVILILTDGEEVEKYVK